LKRVDAVYSSPLERTRETAAPIAAGRGLRVKTDRALLECDYGGWTGAELKKLRRLPEWKAVQAHPSGFTFPGGEGLAAMQLRVVSCLRRLADAHQGGVVVAVSHADPIRAAVVDATGNHLDQFHRVLIGTASITAILYGALGSTLLTLNAYGSLTQLGVRP
jgi:broad specificity phosphatase PhoE